MSLLRLADPEATILLIERIHSNPAEWCPLAYQAYGKPDVFEALLNNLEFILSENNYLAAKQVFWNMPTEWVESVVKQKANLILKAPNSWNALWRTDVPLALSLISQALTQGSERDIMNFFSGLDHGLKRVTKQMLVSLEPTLIRLTDWQRSKLATVAANAGFSKWAQDHSLEWKPIKLVGITDEQMKIGYWLTEETGLSTLNAAASAVSQGHWEVITTDRFHDLENKRRVSFDVKNLLKKWLGSNPTSNQLVVAAMLLNKFGTGEDTSWWTNLKPEVNDLAYKPWFNSIFILRMRRWQKATEVVNE